IGQAVQAIVKAGLRPVVYAKNTGGHQGEWADLTGNAPDFSYLPLWVPRYDYLPDLVSDQLNGVPWKAFGGCGSRQCKQYYGDALWGFPQPIDVDHSIFDRTLLEGPASARPYHVSGRV